MKKKIYPSTPPPISDHLSLLPATILALTVALSPDDRQVLAYLISSCSANYSSHHPAKSKNNKTTKVFDHAPEFECSCFGCYMSYWVRWNNSPNREIIHEIIDAYEEGLLLNKKKGGTAGNTTTSSSLKSKRGKRRGGNYNSSPSEDRGGELLKESKEAAGAAAEIVSFQGGQVPVGNLDKESSSVKKIVSFLGGRIWGVWGGV